MASILPQGKQSFTDNAGRPLVGGKLYTYAAGTTTPQATYADAAGTAPNTNPVILDARGEAVVFWQGAYRVTLKDSAGATIWTVDNVAGPDAAASSYDGGTVQDVLDSAKPMADYAALRAYTGRATSVRITQTGLAGFFARVAGDASSPDNGGTIIVDALGRRWRRLYDGKIIVTWFGADPTYTSDSTAAFQAAIVAGGFDGCDVYAPNGTYKISGTIYMGAYSGSIYTYVKLIGESTGGTVLMRPAGAGLGPILQINGFHNIVESLTIIGNVSAGAYSASHGIYIWGNPQTGSLGYGTKFCNFKNLVIQRVGVGIQLGNYDVDGIDPDIETNSFQGISITECNGGVFINGQNILHNPFYNCHIVNCRDYLVKQTRGSDLWFERSYFGGMYDYLTGNYNVAATSKITVNAGVVGFIGCRSEDWATAVGNLTQRTFLNVSSPASSIIYLVGNAITTRDNATTEPSLSFTGSGLAGTISTKVTLIDNDIGGVASFDTLDIFSVGNTYRGTGGGSVNGRILSANQKTSTFRDVFLDSNQEMELPGAKFKRNSAVPVKIERSAVATGSEFLGHYYYDEPGLLWNRVGVRVTNGVSGSESSVIVLGNRMAGGFNQLGIAYGTASPTAGTWIRGDRVFNSAPAVGQPKSWVCTAAGSPGTWVSEGNL